MTAVALLALVLALFVSACGGSSDSDVELTIGARNFPEQQILGEIYAQALEAAGYEVKRDFNLGHSLAWPFEALKGGYVSGYPEHANTALTWSLDVDPEDVPGDAQAAYEKAKADFEERGATAFQPTPFGLANAVGTLRKTAEEHNLKTVSDLKGKAEEMTLVGPFDCHPRLDCLGGIERYYGLAFKGFTDVDSDDRYKALEKGWVDFSMLYTTDGRLATESDKFVILEDDKHAFPAGNVIFVTSPQVIEEAGPDYEETIVEVQKGLTLEVMRKLNAQVELEKQTPKQAAAAYLKSAG